MTVAVVVKVFDGIVLATDSATTIPLNNAGAAQVYNGADKIFHLHRGLPIAAMTWGLGSIGSASISSLAKDLRRRLMGQDPDFASWALGDTWTIEGVAERMVEMFYDDLFLTEWPDAGNPPGSPLGMMIAGYSSDQKQAEAWEITFQSAATRPVPVQRIDIPAYGWLSFAQPEATERLFFGVDQQLKAQLAASLDPNDWAAVEPLIDTYQRQPVIPPMPFVDAIQFAKFMVETTAQYSHFLLGPDTVGGMVEVAGINRHEGFRWIQRKHYYRPELNPWGHGHAE